MGKFALFNSAVMSAAVATACALATAGPAGAAYPQAEVVSENPADDTAQVVPTDSIGWPFVDSLTSTNGTVYLGGRFDRLSDSSGTHDRHFVAAVDEATGQVEPFSIDVDGRVFTLLAHEDSLYVGGKFRTVNGVSRGNLVKVDAETGAVDLRFQPGTSGKVNDLKMARGKLFVGGAFNKKLVAVDPDTGDHSTYATLDVAGTLPNSAGNTAITAMAIDPNENNLVAIGNFTTVNGQARSRAFKVNLGSASADLSPWYYKPLAKRCLSSSRTKQAYLSDVDFAPDGSYFVLTATGYVPYTTLEIGETICDAAARFETSIDNPFRPTWINYTGGDTVWATAVTGSAVYVQGHFRWLDNPYGKDSLAAGGVVRRGIGAIDPVTGKALPWNSPKPAKIGGKAFLATAHGLWVGSDSLRMKGEVRRGLAFLPLP